MRILPLKKNSVPEPPKSVIQLIGPSFILLGLGLGTGELILWPYLSANWGLGIIWAALIGITIQFFLNMEIERYSLVNGESIFVGFARLNKFLPIWFIVSTIIAWSWPAFATASASTLSFIGIKNSYLISVLMLLLVGFILTLGPTLYKTVESVEKILILFSIPIIVIIAFVVIRIEHIQALLLGLLGIGDGYYFVPTSAESKFPLMTFLAAFAYAGAGGNLLLAQSFYIKEKGYAMGHYAGKITSLITGKSQKIELEGTTFPLENSELKKFKIWWKIATQEHLLVFWGMGLLTMLLLATISYATVYGISGNLKDIEFLYNQAGVINSKTGIFGSILIMITSLMLFSTQLSVIDGASRIISENIAILIKDKINASKMPYIYYSAVWSIITFGIIILSTLSRQPQYLIVMGAVINAVCMFVLSGLLNPTNSRFLPDQVQAPKWRKSLIWFIFAILGIFSIVVFVDQVF